MMLKLPMLALALVATNASLGCVSAEDDDAWNDGPLEVTADDSADDAAFEQAAADDKADGSLTYRAVAQLVVNAGVRCYGDRVALATAVARAESSFRATVTNTVGNAHGVDRGLWQINSYWHPEVSYSCAMSPSCNARAAARISRGSTRWREWWTYNNGKHLPFMPSARAAQAIVCGW